MFLNFDVEEEELVFSEGDLIQVSKWGVLFRQVIIKYMLFENEEIEILFCCEVESLVW